MPDQTATAVPKVRRTQKRTCRGNDTVKTSGKAARDASARAIGSTRGWDAERCDRAVPRFMADFRRGRHRSSHAIDISATSERDRLGVYGFPECRLIGFDIRSNVWRSRRRGLIVVVRFGDPPREASQFTHGSLSDSRRRETRAVGWFMLPAFGDFLAPAKFGHLRRLSAAWLT
jgi:hypothetical protein